MTINRWIFRLALVTIGCMGAGQAADRIRYEELLYRLSPLGEVLEHRGFVVTTLDGKEHGGRRLRLESDHVRIFHRDNSWEDLSIDQISRVKISQAGRFFHHVVASAKIPVEMAEFCSPVDGPGHSPAPCMIVMTTLFSPAWIYTAVTAPFYLASDGVAFLIPPKVYEIVH